MNGIALLGILFAAFVVVMAVDLYRWHVDTLRSKAERQRLLRILHGSEQRWSV